jgi:hypothetical protein
MRRALCFVVLILLAGAAFGQEEPGFTAPPADYSRDALLQIFAKDIDREPVDGRFQHQFGAISFKALGVRWRIGYLPFLAPLPGSQPWRVDDRWPDPFRLTGTQLASPPRTWRQTRDMNAELRKIEKRLRETAKVEVNPE